VLSQCRRCELLANFCAVAVLDPSRCVCPYPRCRPHTEAEQEEPASRGASKAGLPAAAVPVGGRRRKVAGQFSCSSDEARPSMAGAAGAEDGRRIDDGRSREGALGSGLPPPSSGEQQVPASPSPWRGLQDDDDLSLSVRRRPSLPPRPSPSPSPFLLTAREERRRSRGQGGPRTRRHVRDGGASGFLRNQRIPEPTPFPRPPAGAPLQAV
jgi:hypothetical protein